MHKIHLQKKSTRVNHNFCIEDRFFFNRVISVFSVVLKETTLTISVSTCEPVSMESEIVRVFPLSTTEISEITRLKIRSSGSGYLNY